MLAISGWGGLNLCASNAYAETTKDPERLRILDLEKNNDPIGKYVIEILKLAIKKSETPYFLEKLPSVKTPQHRIIQEMSQYRGELDVIWTMTSDERETQLLPIRIPIDKGLMGWRIAFVKTDQAQLLHSVKSLKDLAKLKAGQGYYWPDTEVLKSSGLPVITANAGALFGMLESGRFDYFPRSIIEIWNEQASHSDLPLTVDSALALHYPTAMYFFVAPDRKKLADDLREGLERAIADGSFEAVFNHYCKPFILKAELKNRQVFDLKNPLLTVSSLPLKRSELWYRPRSD